MADSGCGSSTGLQEALTSRQELPTYHRTSDQIFHLQLAVVFSMGKVVAGEASFYRGLA